jgi:hypothetical protein
VYNIFLNFNRYSVGKNMAKAKKPDNENAEKPPAKGRATANKSAASGRQKESLTKTSASETVVETVPESPSGSTKESVGKSDKKAATAQVETVTEQTISTLDGVALPASGGKAGVLGGPKDRGIKPDDKLALPVGRHFTFERVRSLNPKSFYCAMRWEYHLQGKSPEESKRWWANKKLLVSNPQNGNRAVVRAVDFGPHENTGLTISLSPGALEALGIEIGDEVQIEFADQKAPLGVAND